MDRFYTQEQLDARTSDLICFNCGKHFFPPSYQGAAVTAQRDKSCGLCQEVTTVTDYRHFNWLRLPYPLTPREGWKNRHVDGVPEKQCKIEIIYWDVDGEHIFVCEWNPFDPSEYTGKAVSSGNTYWVDMPEEGYQGTVTVIEGKSTGIGFHAWRQHNHSFLYYREIE